MTSHTLPRCLLLAAAMTLCWPDGANAAEGSSPYYLGTSLGVTRVSNVYREANNSNDDTVVSVGLLAGMETRLGRQRLSADGSAQDNRYLSNSTLDNRSYSLRGGLDWETVGNLSGTLGASTSRSLADFNIGRGADLIRSRNLERNDAASFLARYGGLGRYSLEAGVNLRKRDFSAVEYDRFAYSQTETSLGAYALPGAHLRLGLVARLTQGKNPRYPRFFNGVLNGTQVNDYRRRDLDVSARWSFSPDSTLNARLSRSSTDNSLSDIRDFSGFTGTLGGTWQATSKLGLSAQLGRDTGQETAVRGADVNRVYRAVEVGARYALSAKLSASASASWRNGASTSDASPGEAFDKDRSYGLGLSWAYSRSLSATCRYNHGSRDSSTALFSYRANSFGCVAQTIVY